MTYRRQFLLLSLWDPSIHWHLLHPLFLPCDGHFWHQAYLSQHSCACQWHLTASTLACLPKTFSGCQIVFSHKWGRLGGHSANASRNSFQSVRNRSKWLHSPRHSSYRSMFCIELPIGLSSAGMTYSWIHERPSLHLLSAFSYCASWDHLKNPLNSNPCFSIYLWGPNLWSSTLLSVPN